MKQGHPDLSVRRQCSLLSLARSSLYYHPRGESAETLALMKIIDKQFLETPWYGSRQPLGTVPCNALPASGWLAICNERAINAADTGCGG
ncbi:hypothetical protein N9W17_00010 [Jannaschia sp.]|nr:hypothetical protein [Jannaschia sp.]